MSWSNPPKSQHRNYPIHPDGTMTPFAMPSLFGRGFRKLENREKRARRNKR